jgi:hypothetical protein
MQDNDMSHQILLFMVSPIRIQEFLESIPGLKTSSQIICKFAWFL